MAFSVTKNAESILRDGTAQMSTEMKFIFKDFCQRMRDKGVDATDIQLSIAAAIALHFKSCADKINEENICDAAIYACDSVSAMRGSMDDAAEGVFSYV